MRHLQDLTETSRAWSSRSYYFDLFNGELLTTLLRATRVARSFNLQVIIMHASQVCSHHSFGLPLQWNLDITNLYITKPSVQRTIFFSPVIVKYTKKNLEITKPRYSELILPVPWPFVTSRFHCNKNEWNSQKAIWSLAFGSCLLSLRIWWRVFGTSITWNLHEAPWALE